MRADDCIPAAFGAFINVIALIPFPDPRNILRSQAFDAGSTRGAQTWINGD
jgi:hypothetical protein